MTAPSPRQDVVAIGDQTMIAGFALTGVRLLPASTVAEAQAGWRSVSGTAAVVILTRSAADAIGDDRTAVAGPLTVVMPA